MRSQAWRYKLALWLFAAALLLMMAKTVSGLGEWAWNQLPSAPKPLTTSTVTPSVPGGSYQWPH
ncbi:MAG: hypothetical protein AB7G47_20185 [Mycolicibacterium sp.]|uniref:hypothetical protein n=1 Tax=Mycolicibacterium sp. TaxID=2320850 RepID=UPI003D1134FE